MVRAEAATLTPQFPSSSLQFIPITSEFGVCVQLAYVGRAIVRDLYYQLKKQKNKYCGIGEEKDQSTLLNSIPASHADHESKCRPGPINSGSASFPTARHPDRHARLTSSSLAASDLLLLGQFHEDVGYERLTSVQDMPHRG